MAPVLAYPDFKRDFILETHVSINGLSAVLSQTQEDGKVHPVAYASRALSWTEKNYAITELKTLAVVWAVTHFQYYLYGHHGSSSTPMVSMPSGGARSSAEGSRRWRLCTDLTRRMLMLMPCHANPIWMHHSRGLLSLRSRLLQSDMGHLCH